MLGNSAPRGNHGEAHRSTDGALSWNVSRRSLLGAGAMLGLAALMQPTERAYAWASWTNITSPLLKNIGMGDCVHEDLVQIAYARMLRRHKNDPSKDSLLNPWAGTLEDDRRYARIAEDVVDAGKNKKFAGADDLAARLFRENLAYLRIGSFWNDAAANTLADFGISCFNAESVPKFSGADYYTGAWDVGQHVWETNEQNKKRLVNARDALVQFTLNDRNGFMHGMLTSTASHSGFLKQSDVKTYTLQWLGVAYEYARTGKVQAIRDVTLEQAQMIFKGLIDTYGQLDENAHDMSMSLKVGWSEASIKLPRRRLRLRALGMMCHTMEDLWCPAHTCRTYYSGGSIAQNSILAFNNYKMQNGNKLPLFGYHIPFDRYAVADAKSSPNWREALTRGKDGYKGTETLANVVDASMSCLEQEPASYFKTLGMNETIDCITQLFEYLYQDTPWDDVVRTWVDEVILPTYFDGGGQSIVCDAGRRCLHSPTFLIAPIKSMKRAYSKTGLSDNYNKMLAAAKSYDAWQRGAHSFYAGKYNTGSKNIAPGFESNSIWDDNEGERRLIDLVNEVYSGSGSLSSEKQSALLARISCNGCHDMMSALSMMGGMLQEFSVDRTGNLRAIGDETMKRIEEATAFFESGLKGQGSKPAAQSSSDNGLLAAEVAFADEGDMRYVTSNMVVEGFTSFEDGSYLVAVRDLDSLETSIMTVPSHTPGRDKLEEGLANLTISYFLQTEFDDDLDYDYIVVDIDQSDAVENMYLVTGTVLSAPAGAGSLVLDLNGTGELALAVRDEATDIPPVGAYICARYSSDASGAEFIGYDELEAPDKILEATYPVAKVTGSSVLLLTNEATANSQGGYPNYLEVDYGSCDVFAMPKEGYYATVYYHDEAYGDTIGVDENAFAAAMTAESTVMSTQAEDDELNDSAAAEYLELGEEYGNLVYGNEVFHVANVIEGTDRRADDQQPIPDGGVVPSPATDENPPSQPTSPVSKTSAAKSIPKTGDPLPGLGGLLSAAAIAGVAMAAYSARRVANEQAGSDDNEPHSPDCVG